MNNKINFKLMHSIGGSILLFVNRSVYGSVWRSVNSSVHDSAQSSVHDSVRVYVIDTKYSVDNLVNGFLDRYEFR